jgi:tRNA(fMet)-specific endonuclease VapC
LEAEGKSAPFADGQLAAIAHTQGLVLVTRNKKDFERYRGLDLEVW